MVENSRAVFIVGFERCMTSSLATYLVKNGYCVPLVPGVKEPHAFLDPNATALVARARGCWALDASVAYIVKPEALRTIRETVEDYRIIVCMRNQVERTVSAFAYYKSSILRPNDSLDLVFGNAETRLSLARDPLTPAHLRRGPVGRHAYTAILTTLAGISECEADALIDEFVQQSFAQRLLHESKHFKERGVFAPLSVLLHSYYAYFLRQLVNIVDPGRVMLMTPDAQNFRTELAAVIPHWLGTTPAGEEPMPRSNPSRLGFTEVEKARALCASVLGPSFQEETAAITNIAQMCDVRLFSADALYGY